MSEYNFYKLNDKEFESLNIDLLSKELDVRLRRFKAGKDGGIDGLYVFENDKKYIVQVKHWIRSKFQALYNHLEKKELPKIVKLNPSRYILSTSVELSPENKNKIIKLFKPYIKNENDIYGNEDINDLISQYSDIEKKHYKLWIASSNILLDHLNLDITGRSKHIAESISKKIHKYVRTSNHDKAHEILNKLHAVIITGEPGVGKTTLAEALLFDHFTNGFDLVVIDSEISEGEKLFLAEKKIVFYFDDFLGSNYLQAIEKNHDSKIVNFINRIQNDPTKRFILTSRTNILNQGKQLTNKFETNNIDKSEYILSVTKLSRYEKAEILYNHLYYSDIDIEYIREIYKDKRYKEIISHKNYSPRIIDYITDSHKISCIKPEKYWDHVIDSLNNPKDIWAQLFDSQVDDHVRLITLLVSYNGKAIEEHDLKIAFDCAKNDLKYKPSGNFSADFNFHLKIATGSLVNRNIFTKENTSVISFISLFNPSISDFIFSRYKSDKSLLTAIFTSLQTVSSINSLFNLKENSLIEIYVFEHILELLLINAKEKIDKNNFDADYIEELLFKSSFYNDGFLAYRKCMDSLYSNVEKFCSCSNPDHLFFLLKRDSEFEFDEIKIADLIIGYLDSGNLDHEDLLEISHFISRLDLFSDSILSNSFERSVIEFWQQNITDHIIECGYLDDYFSDSVDRYAQEVVDGEIVRILSEYFIQLSDKARKYIFEYMNFEYVKEINDEHAIEQAKEEHRLDKQQGDFYKESLETNYSEDEQIDILFARDDL